MQISTLNRKMPKARAWGCAEELKINNFYKTDYIRIHIVHIHN